MSNQHFIWSARHGAAPVSCGPEGAAPAIWEAIDQRQEAQNGKIIVPSKFAAGDIHPESGRRCHVEARDDPASNATAATTIL